MPFRPESLLPLKISESQARDLIRAWYGRQWLAPNSFSAKALTDTVKGIYLPYWTFDAKADARWTADAGDVLLRPRGQQAGAEGAAGRRRPASSRMSSTTSWCARRSAWTRASCGAIEPFPTDSLVPFDPGYLAGLDGRALSDRSRGGGRAIAGSR